MAERLEVRIVDGKLVIPPIPLSTTPQLSKAGRAFVLASTDGFLPTGETWLNLDVGLSFVVTARPKRN